MKQIKKVQGFTLVELIVVITILAILGTIAFISLQGYSAQARDTTRISDIQNIKKSLELFSLNTGKYPLPDSGTGVLYATELVWTQGIVGENVTTNLSRNLNEKPADPLTETEYTYSVIGSQTKYELLSIYESDLVSYNLNPGINEKNNELNPGVVLQTNAANANYPKISGNYNGIFVKTPTYYIPLPSIITSTDLSSGLTLTDGTVADQIITGGENNIAYGTSESITGKLPDFKISSFSGTISNKNDDNKELLAQVLIDAYSGTILTNVGVYKQIVNSTDLISLVDDVVLSSSTYSSTSGGDDTLVITDWRSIDENCDLPDITLGTQTWAGCNSTLGDGFEFGQTDDDIGTNNYNGIFGNCFSNYDGVADIIPGEACILGDITMASNSKANTWFSGTNGYGDTAVNNIWGKLYTWSNIESACHSGYHASTDEEWTTLENYLSSNNGNSDIGWKNYLGKTTSNNIVKALNIPLAGYRNLDGLTYNIRGYYSFIWTNTSESDTEAYRRYLSWDSSIISRTNYDKRRGLSVRCIKDYEG